MALSTSHGPEYRDCQQPAYELLRDHLGYEHVDGLSEAFAAQRASSGAGGDTEPVLVGRMQRALQKINPGVTDQGIKQAIAGLRQAAATALIDANEACHRLLSRWYTAEEQRAGDTTTQPYNLRYFDFDEPENNDFLVVEEFSIRGPRWTRRLDLVVFVNGIPLVAVECKDPADQHGIEHAVGDLLTYQDAERGVVRLFHTVQLCVALKRNQAYYGSVNTPLNRYAEWKSCYPLSKFDLERRIGRPPTDQDRLLVGMLDKANLLDLARNFVVFDREGGRTVKKVARYQQFEAVNQAIKRIAPGSGADEKLTKLTMSDRGGVVWHTQGSGKSLTMLWLCLKLRRTKALNNPTLMIVTDRRDLDRQITKTFEWCGFENPIRASRVKHLRRLLTGPAGQTVMTTVQKFRDDVDVEKGSRHPVLTDSPNVFVLIDEAHRSEYGQFAAHMRRAVPNACLLAFTGTPIDKTRAKFGSYIHKYTMPQSVADGATVPIKYESRLPELAVWGKQRLDPMFEAEFADLTDEQRQKLKQQQITDVRIAETADDRIQMIAADIAAHYLSNFEPDGFKAQVAACSQLAAWKFWKELERHPKLKGRVALLISNPSDKDSPLWNVKKQFDDEESIIDEFKEASVEKLAIIVVMNKYLTGFDAPIERALYLDKPLKDHTLLQAIARVNRPLPERDKQWGLIIDYWGVTGFLDKALAVFSEDLNVEDVLERRDDEAAYRQLKQRRADVFAMFPDDLDRRSIEPWLLELEDEDRRAIFLGRHRAFYKAMEQLLPDQRALEYLGDFAWLRRVRREMIAHYSQEDTQLPDCSERVRELINRHVRGEQIKVLLEPVDIMSERFTEELQKLETPRAKASRIEHAVKHTITVRLHEDPAFYESMRERLERIISERKDQRIDDAEEFKLLMTVRDEIKRGHGGDAETLGLSDEAYPFYGVLKKRIDADDGDDQKMADLAGAVLDALKQEAVIDWQKKDGVQREMRRKVKRQLRIAGIDDGKLDEVTTAIMSLAEVRL